MTRYTHPARIATTCGFDSKPESAARARLLGSEQRWNGGEQGVPVAM
jgi:hypothetical protein